MDHLTVMRSSFLGEWKKGRLNDPAILAIATSSEGRNVLAPDSKNHNPRPRSGSRFLAIAIPGPSRTLEDEVSDTLLSDQGGVTVTFNGGNWH